MRPRRQSEPTRRARGPEFVMRTRAPHRREAAAQRPPYSTASRRLGARTESDSAECLLRCSLPCPDLLTVFRSEEPRQISRMVDAIGGPMHFYGSASLVNIRTSPTRENRAISQRSGGEIFCYTRYAQPSLVGDETRSQPPAHLDADLRRQDRTEVKSRTSGFFSLNVSYRSPSRWAIVARRER